jgi:alanyl-tRNA synthetase
MALFGEKYGDTVRVIKFGDSVELCGGTHVESTAQIGKFIFTTETAVAAGVRRIEAITSVKADEFVNKELTLLNDIRSILKNPKDIKKHLESVLTQNSALGKEVDALVKAKAQGLKSELIAAVKEVNGVNFLATTIDLGSADAIKDLAFQLKSEIDNLYLVLGAEIKGKPNLTVVLSENLVKDKGLNAGNIIRDLAKEIQGGGGGQPFYATAGGKNAAGIPVALEKSINYIK